MLFFRLWSIKTPVSLPKYRAHCFLTFLAEVADGLASVSLESPSRTPPTTVHVVPMTPPVTAPALSAPQTVSQLIPPGGVTPKQTSISPDPSSPVPFQAPEAQQILLDYAAQSSGLIEEYSSHAKHNVFLVRLGTSRHRSDTYHRRSCRKRPE